MTSTFKRAVLAGAAIAAPLPSASVTWADDVCAQTEMVSTFTRLIKSEAPLASNAALSALKKTAGEVNGHMACMMCGNVDLGYQGTKPFLFMYGFDHGVPIFEPKQPGVELWQWHGVRHGLGCE
jgi:hypothetical protein